MCSFRFNVAEKKTEQFSDVWIRKLNLIIKRANNEKRKERKRFIFGITVTLLLESTLHLQSPIEK